MSFFSISQSIAQVTTQEIKGQVTDEHGITIAGATVQLSYHLQKTITDDKGLYAFHQVPPGSYIVKVIMQGFEVQEKAVNITTGKKAQISFIMNTSSNRLNEVVIKGYKAVKGMGYLNDVHDGVIYSGKKTEVILLDSLNANTAQNNPRQVLGRIPGANYSETEGSGFPSNGIGFRGLNPTQSVETNIRQNGYNVAADIFGYPETYYLPPLEAVERIEVTRGAASLQFGPQFGGVINYIIKKGSTDKALEINIQQTGGSFSLFNSFISAGGQVGKWNYYSFMQYKSILGWRPNSDVQQLSGFAGVNYQANAHLKFGLEYSILRNRIHMPGGFDDERFNLNSQASYRARNWLNSPWNILTGKIDYQFSPTAKLSVKSAYQFSSRNLVWKNEDGGPGTPDSISTVTLQPVNREVQREIFHANTTEARLTADYGNGEIKNTLAAGVRLFYGKMKREGGGLGTTGSDFDLTILDPHYGYNLDFTTTNIAPFVENIFHIGKRLSVTPGFRYEYLRSTVNGYIDNDITQTSHSSKDRSFALFGVGTQFITTSKTNIYANISQAYRPVTYDQLTPFGSATKIAPNLKDADGYNVDLGWRGSVKNYLNFDVSAFYLRYNNRIGVTEQFDGSGTPYLYRTNIANSIHKGVETYIEFNITKALFPGSTIGEFSFYNSFSFIDAKYVSGDFKGKSVEYAPQTINRFGATYTYKVFSTTFLISNTAKSYGDATNTVRSDDPALGLIPAYQVLDWSSSLRLGTYNFKFGINNLADARYFTVRTNEYPGPGIIPAIGRSFYVGFGAKF
ncbi:carboxypeptidase-like regulatory domain-containing protein [Mucilaginibacter sp. ZT4R22]|uniref:Carboxypeptidase-like regulatory domain-containing protein n=1 Tax=Mucilaginibacter pankratovii TaxID=2772110 RepID=A0ABR7WQB5_9SPHI|nr:TonB-dependent receptor [Mucilaginibacter pankratovii]MBD1364516.1 carboxypeptidase-like regulatory domain-containing protein [Mucilaginibacter pankratovii]